MGRMSTLAAAARGLSRSALPAARASAARRPFARAPMPATQRSMVSSGKLNESFVTGAGGAYVEDLHEMWKEDPDSVHVSWKAFFENLEDGDTPGEANALPPSLHGGGATTIEQENNPTAVAARDHMKLLLLVRAYQVRGHYLAHLDPLEISSANIHMEPGGAMPKFLDHKTYGFSDADLDREFYMGQAAIGAASAGVMASMRPQKLSEIIGILKKAYCMGIGVEFMHIADMDQQNWIRNKFEKEDKFDHTKEDIMKMADRLVFACNFEGFLATKYGVTKRFGLEGLESVIPGFKALIDTSAELGCQNFTIGMPHRGRLNVLANVMHKPMPEILEEFISGTLSATEKHEQVMGSGDVKYHLGYSNDKQTRYGKAVHLSLVANPSHLEAANTVVLGKTRAKQHYMADEGSRRKAMSILVHGDAAFAGQGIVWETLGMSDIKGYTTGGVIHLIVNNQIGFTTDPRFARSSPYSTDVAKSVGAPIFHVNADDLEAVCWVCSTAAEFRQKFGKDVVVDIVGYRRYGHNEIDEPTFTQPFMYQRIAQTPTVLQKFKQMELTKGMLSGEEVEAIEANCLRIFEEAFATARENIEKRRISGSRPPLLSSWQGMKDRFEFSAAQETGMEESKLLVLGDKLSHVPADFNIHRGLRRVMDAKKKAFDNKAGIDWATAEALAFGSLLQEGTHVRLSGQDVERGTFSHRHAVLHDQENESKYVPLQNLGDKQQALAIFNSNLSEYGVLGFELGYSMQNPNSLVIWEAQFGDFANTAQVIIDQFIASGEQKWLRQSGLVMLLPHGYEGQGPEHSSARLERFLQMSDEDAAILPDSKGGKESMQIQRSNWQIVNITTPANYFHCLRRQIKRDFRKPLVVFSPKSLLRHPQVVSDLADFTEGNFFKSLIDERQPQTIKAVDKIDRVLLCSGKVYYELVKWRQDKKVDNVAIVTLEQIAPFPFELVQELATKYSNAELVWVQEEPQNMGAWAFVEPRFATALLTVNQQRISYVGRNPAASPATGNGTIHAAEIEQFMTAAFDMSPAPDRMPAIRWKY